MDLLEQILPFIRNSIYPVRSTLSDWRMKEGDHPDATLVTLNDRSWTSIRIPFQWGKYNKTYWFRHICNITPEFAGKSLALLLDFPEALLFINGKPFQGIDQHHNEIWITEKSKLGEKFVIAIQAFSGRKQAHNTFGYAELVVLDPIARRLASSLNILQELDKLMEHGSQESKDTKDLIRQTLIFLKYFRPGSEEYPNAIRRAYNFLLNTLETEFKTTHPGIIHLIGHSHIDVAWLWTLNETIRKCGCTFSSMLRLMDEFPEFRFSQSQAILYEFTKINYPDIYKQIKRRITEGRWEPIGSTWVEPDCNIPNGESFIRQILFGKRFFKQEFGIDSEIIWLPDTFGFNWALPQILKKSGINYFYTSKLTWNDTTVFPFNSFWWQGIDGTKILAHASPVGLEGQIAPKFLIESGKSAEQSAMPPILQTFGYGDGGGGPTKEHLELAIILKTLTGLPSSILSSVREFFKQIEEQSANLPTWNNELYLETHRGTYTTHAWIKKENRLSETLLYTSELLSTIAMIFGKSIALRRYPKNELDQAWKKLLLNQFHDIIPGTAIADVYKDTQDDYQWIKGTCLAIIQNCIQGFSKVNRKSRTEFQFSIFNPLNWARNEYIELFIKSKDKHFSIEDEKGKSIIYQIVKNNKLEQRLLCYVEDIPAFGFKNLIVRAQHGSADSFVPWKTSTHGLESPLFKVHLDCKGTFSSIYAKHHRRELIQKGKRGNIFYTFQDIPKQWEAWNIESDYEKYKIELWKFKHMKFIEHGPLRATIRLEFKSDNGSTISQDVLLYHQLPRIDFQTSVRWLERQTLMKVAFPFNLKRPNATYEIPFGAINRSTKPTIGWDKAKFEVPSQQWADISDTKFGISLLNDSKYGYDAKENTLRLTILRSPHYPHTNEPWCSDEDLIDQGNHTFCYSIYPHNNNWAQGETVRRARELNNPIIVFPNSIVEGIPSILTSSKPNIIVDAIKKAENNDSIIIRIHEAHGIATESAFHLNVNSKDVLECDLLENDLKPIKIKRDKLSLKFRPFEIKTIKINLKPLKKKK